MSIACAYCAQFAFGFDPGGPGDDQVIGAAAAIDLLLPAAEWRVAGWSPLIDLNSWVRGMMMKRGRAHCLFAPCLTLTTTIHARYLLQLSATSSVTTERP